MEETNNIWKLGERNYIDVIKRGSVIFFPDLIRNDLYKYFIY